MKRLYVLSGEAAYSRAIAVIRSFTPFHLMYQTLLVEAFNCCRYMPVGPQPNGLLQLRVSLAKNLIQLDCVHPCFLKLRKWMTRFHAFMLT